MNEFLGFVKPIKSVLIFIIKKLLKRTKKTEYYICSYSIKLAKKNKKINSTISDCIKLANDE